MRSEQKLVNRIILIYLKTYLSDIFVKSEHRTYYSQSLLYCYFLLVLLIKCHV